MGFMHYSLCIIAFSTVHTDHSIAFPALQLVHFIVHFRRIQSLKLHSEAKDTQVKPNGDMSVHVPIRIGWLVKAWLPSVGH